MTAAPGKPEGLMNRGLRLWRVREYWDKLLHVVGCAALLGIRSGRAGSGARELILYGVAIFFLLVGGYTINDAADYSQDRRSGREAGRYTPPRRLSLFSSVAGIATGMLLVALTLKDALAILIAAGTVIAGLEYSLPPFRFKEHGLWGVFFGALTQRPAMFLVYAAMIHEWNRLTLILAVWLLFGGMTTMLGHQILDHRHDLAAGVRTFVSLNGPGPALRIGAGFAAVAGLAVFAPLVFMPLRQAGVVTGVLAALSIVYPAKALPALRRLSAPDLGTQYPFPNFLALGKLGNGYCVPHKKKGDGGRPSPGKVRNGKAIPTRP
jgi:4-hydroxybenzoate polyprenyltransferase